MPDAHFTAEWWRDFQARWNAWEGNKAAFGEVRHVFVQVSDAIDQSVLLEWDINGVLVRLEALNEAPAGVPVFSADRSVWTDFIYRSVPAATLLMRKRLNYQGPLPFLLRWGTAFSAMSEVGRLVPIPHSRGVPKGE